MSKIKVKTAKKPTVKTTPVRSTRKLPEAAKSTDPNSKYAIEKGVPITSLRMNYRGGFFPLEQMGIGDSFLIPAGDPVCKNPNTLHYAAKQYARLKPGFTVTTRMLLDKSRRVWRIK